MDRVGKCANSWTGRADPLQKRGEDVLMVMKMAKSTPVLINEGSFCARNLFAGTLRILSGNPFHDFDSRFRLYAQHAPFASLFVFPAAALTSLTFFSD